MQLQKLGKASWLINAVAWAVEWRQPKIAVLLEVAIWQYPV